MRVFLHIYFTLSIILIIKGLCATEGEERVLNSPSYSFASFTSEANLPLDNFTQRMDWQKRQLPTQVEIEETSIESENAVFKRLIHSMSTQRANELALKLVKQPENLTKAFETIVSCLTRDTDGHVMDEEGKYQVITALTNVAPEHLSIFVFTVREIPLNVRAQWMRYLSTRHPKQYQEEINRVLSQKTTVKQRKNDTRKLHYEPGYDYEQVKRIWLSGSGA